MLDAIRRHTGSIVVKALLAVLLLSFVVWGIADIVRPMGGKHWVARAGDVEISPEQFRSAYEREIARLSQMFGQRLDPEEARRQGLPERVARQMALRAAMELEAERLGIVVPDALVRENIQKEPAFFNNQGQFDMDVLRARLHGAGLTESQYVELVRSDLRRAALSQALEAPLATPAPIVDRLFRYVGEKRTLQTLRIEASDVKEMPAATDAALNAFYEGNKQQFMLPDRRTVSFILLSSQDLAGEIAVDDASLRAAYNTRREEFSSPEKRHVLQMVLPTEDAARNAASHIAAGKPFLDVAKSDAGLAADAADLGFVTRGALFGDLGATVFALPVGQVSQPIRSPLGWHLLQVTAIEASHEQPFEEVRHVLLQEVQQERALDAFVDLGNRLEDTLGGGASLEQAAASLGLTVRTIKGLTADGRDATGQLVDDLPETLPGVAFSTPAGEISALEAVGSGAAFILRVDDVQPSGVEPLADIPHDRLLAVWMAHQREFRASAMAEHIAERVTAGQDLAAAGRESKVAASPVTSPPVTRYGTGFSESDDALPREVVTALFNTPVGQVRWVRADGAVYVGRATSVIPADPAAEQAARSTLAERLSEGLRGSFLVLFTDDIGRRWKVEINHEALDGLS